MFLIFRFDRQSKSCAKGIEMVVVVLWGFCFAEQRPVSRVPLSGYTVCSAKTQRQKIGGGTHLGTPPRKLLVVFLGANCCGGYLFLLCPANVFTAASYIPMSVSLILTPQFPIYLICIPS